MFKIKNLNNLNNNMILLVTGGCGFIGSNFINYYFSKNPNVIIINVDAMYYCANELNVNENVRNSNRYKIIKGNLTSYDLIFNLLNIYNVDHVIHFAAQSHVENSFDNALQYTSDNIVGTHTLLEACRKYGKIIRFIHISTDEVYGESMLQEDEDKKVENSVLCPTNPYAATKAGAELIAKSYYHSFKMPIIITRGNNVYGENQYPEKLIPRFIKLLNENNKVTIQGDGTNVRAFLHVFDVCNGITIILEKGIIGEIYNIGSDDHHEYSVSEIAKILISKIKNTSDYNEWIEYIKDRPFNDKRYYISNQKLKDLGWDITITFEDGLDRLIDKYNTTS
jgi:dTDP-glucose 4,6-dehydratase